VNRISRALQQATGTRPLKKEDLAMLRDLVVRGSATGRFSDFVKAKMRVRQVTARAATRIRSRLARARKMLDISRQMLSLGGVASPTDLRRALAHYEKSFQRVEGLFAEERQFVRAVHEAVKRRELSERAKAEVDEVLARIDRRLTASDSALSDARAREQRIRNRAGEIAAKKLRDGAVRKRRRGN
jgi:hypothetical protein